MNSERDDLSKFLDVYLDYLENARDEPPALEDLPEEQRLAAESFIRSIKAARGWTPTPPGRLSSNCWLGVLIPPIKLVNSAR